jgi:hypothetical protein
MSPSFKPGEVEMHDRETDIRQAVNDRATVPAGCIWVRHLTVSRWWPR